MAEENAQQVGETVVVDAPAKLAPSRKTAAPRRTKAAAEAVAPAAAVKQSKKSAQKRAGEDTAKLAQVAAQAAKGKPGKQPKIVKPVVKSAVVTSSAADEMSDLLQLEEENKKLRGALAEKLRSENADLRKKLGLK